MSGSIDNRPNVAPYVNRRQCEWEQVREKDARLVSEHNTVYPNTASDSHNRVRFNLSADNMPPESGPHCKFLRQTMRRREFVANCFMSM